MPEPTTIHPQWRPAASPPALLEQGTVDVWRVDLAAVDALAMQLLCAQERARAAAIVDPARRALWMRGRGVLRALLGAYLKRPADELQLVLGAHGKPALAREAGTASVLPSFNLSHSGTLALYAFTLAAELGIDIEAAGGRVRDEPAIAARMWGLEQAQRLRSLSSHARAWEFLRLWVTHEAALKCTGLGLGGGNSTTGSDSSERLWLAELDLAPRAAAAVAMQIQGEPRELRFWTYPT
jgi:4'-phosphopantetheinyl transferase